MTSMSGGTSPSPLNRVAGMRDYAHVAQASGARLTFPTFRAGSSGGQVWVHYYVDGASGGTVDAYVDRGTDREVKRSYLTLQSGVTKYARSILVADGLAAGDHAIEIETTSSGPVRVLGVTYVGAP